MVASRLAGSGGDGTATLSTSVPAQQTMLTSMLIVFILVPEHRSQSAVLAAARCVEEAEASLSQCVHACKDDALDFAFLCDELAAAVEARSLAEPLIGWLQQQLQLMLSQLVVQGSPADAQVSSSVKGPAPNHMSEGHLLTAPVPAGIGAWG